MSAEDRRRAALDHYHHLRWRLACKDADGSAFEALFLEAMTRIHPETFTRVRPYGNLGDRKTDGLHFGDGTAYQVYSPNVMRLADAKKKIRTDLEGAVGFWGDDLQRWTFVYNQSRGVAGGGIPTDLVGFLQHQSDAYGSLEVDLLSDDKLWDRFRDVDPDVRSEVLGPLPDGWDGGRAAADEAAENGGRDGVRLVFVANRMSRVDEEMVAEALAPETPLEPMVKIAPDLEELGWEEAAHQQASDVEVATAEAPPELARFAVFPLAEIPLLIHLGVTLADTTDVRVFNWHRDLRTWRWDEDVGTEPEFRITGLPDEVVTDPCDLCLRVSVSATVRPEQTAEVIGDTPVAVDLEVSDPSRTWLRRHEQLVAFRRLIREIYDDLLELVPACERIHVFAAVPPSAAVAMGQTYNPRMNHSLRLYQCDARETPSYRATLDLPMS